MLIQLLVQSSRKKDESEHRAIIEKSIQDWCIKNANIINFVDSNPISVVHYDLQSNPFLDKVEIRYSYNLVYHLLFYPVDVPILR